MLNSDIPCIQNSLYGQLDLHLLFYGKEYCQPLHSWGPGLRDSYIIHYVHSGKGRFNVGDQIYTINGGQGFLITPGVLVQYEADEQEPWTYSWVGFNGLQASSFLEMADLSEKHPVFNCVNVPFFDHLYDDLLAASKSKSRPFLFQSLLYRFFAELVESAEHSAILSPLSTKESYLRAAKEWIEHNYSQTIKVTDIADYVGLNSTYLSSLFQEQYGLSLQAYLLQFRMKRAHTLLQNQGLSISDISRSVGYRDPFLFSKMFKKVIGVSPSKARELHHPK